MSMSRRQQDYVAALTAQHPNLVARLNIPNPVTSREASDWIENVKVECLNAYGNRAGSMRAIISDRIAGGWSTVGLNSMLGKEYGYGDIQRKIEFSANVNGRRIPKPMGEQKRLMDALIDDLRADLQRRGTPAPMPVDPPSSPDISSDDVPVDDPTPEPEPEPVANNDMHPFLAKLREIRSGERVRSEVEGKRTPILEAVSGNRPAINAAKMLKQGIPTEALLHALAMDWPSEARSRYNIPEYDVNSFGEAPEDRHSAYAYVKAAIDSRVPVCLIGPAGTFKSTLCKQIAEDMGLNYGFVPMTAGATPSWIVGAYTLDGYRSRSAMDCYEHGGVFVFEEMDAADPNMLLVANNLIENDVFDNPVTGEQITRHEDFIPVACMNSMGLGATATNTGRSRLDDATRNRFAMGRVNIMLDEDLEEKIFDQILNG